MIIQIDSREKARAIKKIIETFNQCDITHLVSKLYVGDYMSYDNPRLVIDRKQNLSELCSNVCQQHDRFRRELIRAQEAGIHIIFLVEHGADIRNLEDVIWWKNPRSVRRVCDSDGHWRNIPTKAMTGDTLYKILLTMQRKYDCEFRFCKKNETGQKIIEILGGGMDDKG